MECRDQCCLELVNQPRPGSAQYLGRGFLSLEILPELSRRSRGKEMGGFFKLSNRHLILDDHIYCIKSTCIRTIKAAIVESSSLEI